MKIEVGKKYINASGEVVEILTYTSDSQYPYDCSINSYIENGQQYHLELSNEDLICEVNEDIYRAYKQDLITKKEFLNKHFELYSGMTIEDYNAKNQDN